jgi:hypothetical protein
MKPTVPVALDAVLREIKDMIKTESDAKKRVNMISMVTILTVIRRDWDGAAANRVEDIEKLFSILNRGAEIAPVHLSIPLNKAISEAKQSYRDIRISTLEATLESLMTVLIDLQIWLETDTSVEAKKLLEEIYSFLMKRASRLAMLKKMW